MRRSLAATTMGLFALVTLTACGGASCESVQDEIEEIGREIQADPSKSQDEGVQERLTELGQQLQEMGCFE